TAAPRRRESSGGRVRARAPMKIWRLRAGFFGEKRHPGPAPTPAPPPGRSAPPLGRSPPAGGGRAQSEERAPTRTTPRRGTRGAEPPADRPTTGKTGGVVVRSGGAPTTASPRGRSPSVHGLNPPPFFRTLPIRAPPHPPSWTRVPKGREGQNARPASRSQYDA